MRNKMNIADIQYSLETASIEIYLAGCNPPHCHGCHNEALWNFNAGLPWDYWINGLIENYRFMGDLVQGIWVLGGEPLDQPQRELVELLTELHKHFDKPVWLFTRYHIPQIPCDILRLCDYVKTGRYKIDMGSGVEEYGVLMATANQHVTKIQRECYKWAKM